MVTIVVPLLVLVVGAMVYALPTNPKVAELGRLAYAAGLLWAVYEAARVAVHL